MAIGSAPDSLQEPNIHSRRGIDVKVRQRTKTTCCLDHNFALLSLDAPIVLIAFNLTSAIISLCVNSSLGLTTSCIAG